MLAPVKQCEKTRRVAVTFISRAKKKATEVAIDRRAQGGLFLQFYYSKAILSFMFCSAILADLMANCGVSGAGVFIVDEYEIFA